MAQQQLRLLSLDGGGVRGLASLYMLRTLLAQSGGERPCDFFDMIAGTSTGGLIAIMLGCLEMTVDECIEAYIRLMGTIFNRQHLLPFSLLNGKIQARYSTGELEDAIKDIIRSKNLNEDMLMRSSPSPRCKTFVVAISGGSRELTHFTNYPKSGESSTFYDKVKLWEAARATSAATSFFEPMFIDGSKYWDGGVGANNPVDRLWREAKEAFGPDLLEPRVRCVLSVGTGRPALKDFGSNVKDVGQTLIDIVTETEGTADAFYENHESLAHRDVYFRFNPTDLDGVGMDEAGKGAIIRERTEIYAKHYQQRSSIRRFQEVAGKETNEIPMPNDIHVPSRLFYTLGQHPKHIHRGTATPYWQHLTYEAYQIYERIALDGVARSGHPNQKVYFMAFLQSFNATRPTPRKVAEVWARLLRDKSDVANSRQPLSLVMATLYMLHIESFIDDSRPVDLDHVDGPRRRSLKRFDRWIPCECKRACGKEWCFVNDVGLSRGGGVTSKCDVKRYFERSGATNALWAKNDGKIVEKMREKWVIPRHND